MGRKSDLPGARELVISRTAYKAIYVVSDDGIEVIRILHGAQEWPPSD